MEAMQTLEESTTNGFAGMLVKAWKHKMSRAMWFAVFYAPLLIELRKWGDVVVSNTGLRGVGRRAKDTKVETKSKHKKFKQITSAFGVSNR